MALSNKIISAKDYNTDCQLLAFVVLAFDIVSVHFGQGTHSYYLSTTQQYEALKWAHAMQGPWIFSMLLARLSISCFLIRLFVTNNKRRWTFYAFNGFMVVTALSIFLIPNLAYCNPKLKYWEPSIPGKCVGSNFRDGINYYTSGKS